jgi:adenylate kinase
MEGIQMDLKTGFQVSSNSTHTTFPAAYRGDSSMDIPKDTLVKSVEEKDPGLIPDLRHIFRTAPIEDKKETVPVKDMFITLIGPPGAGKGTQGEILSERYGIPHISVGSLLRSEIAAGSELGLKAKPFVERGDLCPPDLTAACVKNRLQQEDCKNGFILDGYPRNNADMNHFEAFSDEIGVKNYRMICIDLPEEEATKRLLERGRPDDTPEVIKHRFNVYRNETLPVMDYYKAQDKYVEIDGMGGRNKVTDRLTDLLDPKDDENGK